MPCTARKSLPLLPLLTLSVLQSHGTFDRLAGSEIPDAEDSVEEGSDEPDSSSDEPEIFLLPTVSCPRFNYFKRVDEDDLDSSEKPTERTKFGSEDTHVCFLGKEPCKQGNHNASSFA